MHYIREKKKKTRDIWVGIKWVTGARKKKTDRERRKEKRKKKRERENG